MKKTKVRKIVTALKRMLASALVLAVVFPSATVFASSLQTPVYTQQANNRYQVIHTVWRDDWTTNNNNHIQSPVWSIEGVTSGWHGWIGEGWIWNPDAGWQWTNGQWVDSQDTIYRGRFEDNWGRVTASQVYWVDSSWNGGFFFQPAPNCPIGDAFNQFVDDTLHFLWHDVIIPAADWIAEQLLKALGFGLPSLFWDVLYLMLQEMALPGGGPVQASLQPISPILPVNPNVVEWVFDGFNWAIVNTQPAYDWTTNHIINPIVDWTNNPLGPVSPIITNVPEVVIDWTVQNAVNSWDWVSETVVAPVQNAASHATNWVNETVVAPTTNWVTENVVTPVQNVVNGLRNLFRR